MRDYRLRVGMRFMRRSREYVIQEPLRGGKLKIRDEESGTCFAQETGELVADLFAGKIELIGEEGSGLVLLERLGRSGVTDLTMLAGDDPLKRELLRRKAYVDEVFRAKSRPRSEGALRELIARVGKCEDDASPPSSSTLRRWIKIYTSSGGDVRALAPSYKTRGNRRGKIAGKRLGGYTEADYDKAQIVAEIIDRMIKTKYLTRQRLTAAEVYGWVEQSVVEENRFRSDGDKLPMPAPSTVYRAINRLDPYNVALAREGKRIADEKFRVNKPGPRPTRALERVECDHTRLDMMAVDPVTRLPLGRPWLTTVIDVHTKMILGFYLAFHRPGAVSVLQCLLHAIRPKDYVRHDYPSIQHDWPAYGVPEWLVVDNGAEFHGDNLEDACAQLGVGIQYSPVGCPWYRPSIERWFGTQNKRLLHSLPGTTFSNIFEKADYDPNKHAVITIHALREMIHIWIVDLYHQQIHRGIQDIPYRRWKESVADFLPNLPPRAADLEVLVGFVEHRTVGPSGVELFGLKYNRAELGLIRRTLAEGEKVKVKYDPNDISMIYVWDKTAGRFITTPAMDQDYTAGLTLWQHVAIKRFKRLYLHEQVDVVSLCQARMLLQKIVESERSLTKQAAPAGGSVPSSLNLLGSSEVRGLLPESGAFGILTPAEGTVIKLVPERTGATAGAEHVIDDADDDSAVSGDGSGAGWGAGYDLPGGEAA